MNYTYVVQSCDFSYSMIFEVIFMADIPVIYILSRNNYNNFGDENYGNNIFFVRENSENLNDMVSLYVGKAKQSDVVIVNGQSVWNNITNNVKRKKFNYE